MAVTDSGTAILALRLFAALIRTQDSGAGQSSRPEADHDFLRIYTNGADDGQYSGLFSATFVVTTSRVTLRLASATDPLQGLGDDVPSSDPAGLHIKAMMVENLGKATPTDPFEPTVLIGIDSVTGPLISIFGGTNPTVKLGTQPRYGAFAWAGQSPAAAVLSTGSNDGMSIQATDYSANVRLTYLFG